MIITKKPRNLKGNMGCSVRERTAAMNPSATDGCILSLRRSRLCNRKHHVRTLAHNVSRESALPQPPIDPVQPSVSGGLAGLVLVFG